MEHGNRLGCTALPLSLSARSGLFSMRLPSHQHSHIHVTARPSPHPFFPQEVDRHTGPPSNLPLALPPNLISGLVCPPPPCAPPPPPRAPAPPAPPPAPLSTPPPLVLSEPPPVLDPASAPLKLTSFLNSPSGFNIGP
ncbi:unnamed protein product [Closterium sp. NIES-54]